MCSRLTLPKGRSAGAYQRSPSPRSAAPAPIGRPTAQAAASASRNSRRVTSLIDRRLRIRQQGHDILDLLLGEDALVAEARHVRARGERLRVVDLAVRVTARLVGVAAQLAELIERRADGAVRELLAREPVTRIAVGANR